MYRNSKNNDNLICNNSLITDESLEKNNTTTSDNANNKISDISENNDVLHNVDLILLNNGWNDKNEQIIISIGENAASYKWMHEKAETYNKTMYKITNIILIILNTLLSAETIIPNDNENTFISILKKVVIYTVTLISVLQNFLKSQEAGEKHSVAAGAFSELYHDIQQQMCMFRRDRTNAKIYVSNCLKTYDSLIVNNPDINDSIIKKFKMTFKNSDIALPDIADKIQKIEIITEPTTNIKGMTINTIESKEESKSNLHSNNLNCNNLAQIHNVFQIHGDINDNDINDINGTELKQLKNKFMQQKINYEYQRFLQHSLETD